MALIILNGLVEVETIASILRIYHFLRKDYIFIPVGCWTLEPVIKGTQPLR